MFAKKCIHIKVGKLLFFLSTWHFDFFCIYLLHFYPFNRTPPIWECLGNFHAHHKLDIKTFCTIKGMTSKVTAEDDSVPFVVLGIPGIKSFFLTI